MAEAPGIIFFGTPHFAAVVLKILADWAGGRILAVFTQPDRPAGRGKKIRPGECAALARELGIPLYQPENLRAAAPVIAELSPDILAVAAYGLLIPQNILEIPRLGSINVHASLLPAYRGAAPVARAIIENWQPDAMTGVSIMEVVKELDAGAVYAQKEVPIARHDLPSLTDLLAREGGTLLVRVIEDLAAGVAVKRPQEAEKASYARKLERSDGELDWQLPAGSVEARIRGTRPWPGARLRARLGEKEHDLVLHAAELGEMLGGEEPGTIALDGDGLKIACADRWLKIARLCVPGKKEISSRDFINGHLRGCPPGICGKAI